MKHTFTTSDGIRLAYCIDDYTDPWKTPATLLMLHSAMSSAKRFYSMVPGLAKHYRVIRLDSRGHGDSEVPPPHVVHDKWRLERFIGHWTDTWFMDEVSKIQCPTLIVEPGAHPIGTGAAFAEMEKHIPKAERIVYENGRHNVFDYLPERCVTDTLAFLQKHFPGERS